MAAGSVELEGPHRLGAQALEALHLPVRHAFDTDAVDRGGEPGHVVPVAAAALVRPDVARAAVDHPRRVGHGCARDTTLSPLATEVRSSRRAPLFGPASQCSSFTNSTERPWLEPEERADHDQGAQRGEQT